MRTLVLVLLPAFVLMAGCEVTSTPRADDPTLDSGGPLLPEQASYDVQFYDLDLEIMPDSQAIAGTLTATVNVVSPMIDFVLDLDPRLGVDRIEEATAGGGRVVREYRRADGRLWIDLRRTRQPGEQLTVAVTYGGKPRVAPNPPWDGGFTWDTTATGQPWIATTCQTNGADLWWPVKDHPSDEPDSMAIHVNVPYPLVVASNGRLRSIQEMDYGRRTYHWFVSSPINNYGVALNIAPYEKIERQYTSVTGETFPAVFYVLPEDYDKGVEIFPQFLDHLRFFEELIGPYPFRYDKYGVAETPHLGMEHQTIIAYGANFSNTSMTHGKDWGYDALHHHELSHEWWGNLVTNADWSDMWLHEGFAAYMQPLYSEKLGGIERYHEAMNSSRQGIQNARPVAPRGVRSTQQIYGGDIYSKGSWVLHTLRYLVGDDDFFQILRRMAYPDTTLIDKPHCAACRFATTEDFVTIAENVSGRDLGWFFEVYLRQPALPRVTTTPTDGGVTLRWEVPQDLPFPMPVDVRIGDEVRRVEMPEGTAVITVPDGAEVTVDPDDWVLRADQ